MRIKNNINIKPLNKKFFTFLFVGLISAFFDLLVFNLLFPVINQFQLARAFAVFFAVLFNFILNRNLTFEAGKGLIKKQFPKHIVVYSFVMLTNVLVSSFIFHILGYSALNSNIASVSGILSGIPISFFGSLLWTFSRK